MVELYVMMIENGEMDLSDVSPRWRDKVADVINGKKSSSSGEENS